MPRIQYVEQRFSKASLAIIERANQIIEEYRQQGFSLTLRQLYYQFVARGFLPNQQREYKKLGSTISNARLTGLIDWHAIEDRTRNLMGVTTWDGPEHIIRSAAAGYEIDKWADQPIRPEVWVEKEALTGVVAPICHELQIDYFACRDYTSQSEQWRASRRFAARRAAAQEPVVFHLGDHDPSGIDMTRDNADRLALFLEGEGVEVRRLALNMDQVRLYRAPPNPAKMTDTRVGRYIRVYGRESWELDALDPPIIARLIGDAVLEVRDETRWQDAVETETAQKAALQGLVECWSEVSAYLRDLRGET